MAVRVWIIGLLFLAIGCQEDGVRVVRVPKTLKQTLGVIVPRADATWFLKLNGPADVVAADEPAFREFATSIRFEDGEPPIKYSAPRGWEVDDSDVGKGGMFKRFATLRTANDCEVIITKLGGEANAVLPNVNRWRGELGVESVTESELEKLVEPVEVGGTRSTFVYVGGRAKPSEGR